jgi:uncharacterized protein YebE (UPF0316 family)
MREFLTGNSVWLYILIFFGKILEVTAATLRIVLINRGERAKGAAVALLEVSLWLFVTGTVLADFQNSPIKIVVFCVAFAIGCFMGSWLEDKIAVGLSTIEVITDEEPSVLLAALRANNLAVTTIDAEGKDGPRKILEIHLKRSRVRATVGLINSNISRCMISVRDVKVINGGYIKK